jgi:hypothetical protein
MAHDPRRREHMSSQEKSRLEGLSTKILQLRDELEVQLNLGAAEARDEWAQLESKLGEFKNQIGKVADVAEESGEGVMEAASLAGEEILKGYEKLKELAKG